MPNSMDQLMERARARWSEAVVKAKVRKAEQYVADSADLAPRPGSPYGLHPYAKPGGSATMFKWHFSGALNVVVTNTSEHWKYTNRGYTRKGIETAVSYIARGAIPYAQQVVNKYKGK